MNSDDEMTNDYDGEAWWYVGRFMSSFATIEAGVDRALYELFDLDLILYSLLTSNLELRKKLIFVRAAMEQQGVQDSAVVKKIHKLHDIRNMLAHSQFTISDEGIEFGYSGKQLGSEKFDPLTKAAGSILTPVSASKRPHPPTSGFQFPKRRRISFRGLKTWRSGL
jgi:hypothetical protein